MVKPDTIASVLADLGLPVYRDDGEGCRCRVQIREVPDAWLVRPRGRIMARNHHKAADERPDHRL